MDIEKSTACTCGMTTEVKPVQPTNRASPADTAGGVLLTVFCCLVVWLILDVFYS